MRADHATRRWDRNHPIPCSGDMTIQRMDNIFIAVDDLEAAQALFAELGLEAEGEAPVEGRWVDRVVGLNDVRADIAMMRTPDGHSRLELMRFHRPPAVSRAEARRRTRWAYDASCSLLTTSTTSLRACASTVPPRRRDRAVRGHLPALLPSWP